MALSQADVLAGIKEIVEEVAGIPALVKAPLCFLLCSN